MSDHDPARSRSLIDAVAAARAAGLAVPTPGLVQRRMATVTAVAASSVTLDNGGDGLPGIRYNATYVPAVGDLVDVEVSPDGQWRVIGTAGTGNEGQPWRSAADKTAVTINAGQTTSASVAVVFPVDRFTVAPIVTLGIEDTSNRVIPVALNHTATGMDLRLSAVAALGANLTRNIHWHAVQMTPTTAAG